jgi:putative phosphoesterase
LTGIEPQTILLDLDPPLTLGVISDTHVPDRSSRLNPAALEVFRRQGVAHILHAGDISVPRVLAELGEVAPVTAVRGNRDWLLRRELPIARVLEVAGVRIGLTHGHGGWSRYLLDKAQYVIVGYRVGRYLRQLETLFPQAQLVVFGHTHRPVYLQENGKAYFNPGPAGVPREPDHTPSSVGLIHIDHGSFTAEIVPLRPK